MPAELSSSRIRRLTGRSGSGSAFTSDRCWQGCKDGKEQRDNLLFVRVPALGAGSHLFCNQVLSLLVTQKIRIMGQGGRGRPN